MFDNLDTYMAALNNGVKPMQVVQLGFVHNETKGVHAIDPSPLKKGALATRLYVYPDQETETVHVLTVGDKNSQSTDVNDCSQWVTRLLKQQAEQAQEEPSEAIGDNKVSNQDSEAAEDPNDPQI